MTYLIIALTAIVSYLIGSVNFSILLSKMLSGKDIRESGSGNAGATNMLRTYGKKMGVITLLLDVLKGIVVILLSRLVKNIAGTDEIYPVISYIAGVCVILGHNFPLYFGFKGGKGVATSLGVVLMLDWKVGLIVAVVAIAVMAVTRYVSLGSILGGAMYIVIEIVKMIVTKSVDVIQLVCVVIIGGLLIARHHANIKRLLKWYRKQTWSKKRRSKMKIAVIGSGGWGTAIAILLSSRGHNVYLWSWIQEETDRLKKDRENKEFLPGVKFPDTIYCSHDMAECTDGAELIITAAPSPATRTTAKQLSPHVKEGQKIVNISKGLEEGTLLRLSQVYKEEIPQADISVMSGPSHAEEVSRGLPTTNVVASEHIDTAKFIQDVFMGDMFRVYTSTDIIGVELGGALKNVIALCAGISDGLGYGDNTKAALMTRGLAEIARLGKAMGANEKTFMGLSGVGDLIVTCTSMHSRNRRAGILLGQGKSLKETLESVHMVVEGVNTATAAYEMAHKYNVEMPIVEEAYNILYNGRNAREAVLLLMTREKREEK